MYGGRSSSAEVLHAAWTTLQAYFQLLVDAPAQVPLGMCQDLLDMCLRHLRLLSQAGVSFSPKHHLWCHLTVRIRSCGNPRDYSTLLDESLNRALANIAVAAQCRTWEHRTFTRVRLFCHKCRSSLVFLQTFATETTSETTTANTLQNNHNKQ